MQVSIIDLAKEAWPRLRKFFIYTLISGIGVSSLIAPPDLKIAIMSALGVALMFFLFDIYTVISARLNSIEQRLPHLESKPYDEFSFIVPDLKEILTDRMHKKRSTHVEIISVSAHCSWPFFQKYITSALENYGGKIRLKLDIMISSDETLKRWRVPDWLALKRGIMTQHEMFMRNHKLQLVEADVDINIYEHDNIPHWHGVMLDRQILFLGRTEWTKKKETGAWVLKVGQVEYRKFTKGDSFGGTPRLLRFGYWSDRYRDRHAELHERVEVLSQSAELGNSGT